MRYVRTDGVLDPEPYLQALPDLEHRLSTGTHRFARHEVEEAEG